MSEKITYILGAGASIGAFPLVKPTDQWDGKGLADSLMTTSYSHRKRVNVLENEETKISKALFEVGLKGKEFGNIDSYAKYLYHTNQNSKLVELKFALTFYFTQTQLCQNQYYQDKRYLNFITSIITPKHQFPDNVKILNWNYDYLLENAGMLYGKEEFNEGKVSIRKPPFIDYFPHCGYEFNLTHSYTANHPFSVVHMNGIAGFYTKTNESGNSIFHSIFNDLTENEYNKQIQVKDLIEALESNSIDSHLLTFAWEKNSQTNASLANSYEIAKTIIKDTSILVIIGYSFPFYNREVDNMIFEVLKPSLKKIYYQDPYIDGKFLNTRYNLGNRYTSISMAEAIREDRDMHTKLPLVDIEHIFDTDQFYIPVEL